jgi:hypothetical protein
MILNTISAGHARLALRIYFLLVMMIVTWLADKTLTARAKLQVVRKRAVPVPRVLGWLQGFDLLKSVWSLRALPGGKLGYIFMVFMFIFSKLDDLVTTTFVKSVQVQSRCQYSEGMVFNTTTTLFTSPPANGRPYIWANNAQINSMNNTCRYGIYNKINEDNYFCASDQDILGTWQCSTVSTDTYPFASTTGAVTQSLEEKGLLFPGFVFEYSGYPTNCNDSNSDTPAYDHLVAWSTSAGLDTNMPWNVSAAIQTNADPCAAVTMQSMTCYMDAPPAEGTASRMNSSAALTNWRLSFQGLMYYGSLTSNITQPEEQLVLLLNTMLMVQGGSNYLLQTLAPDADQTYGCLKFATEVPVVVEALVFISAALLVVTFLALLIIQIRLMAQPKAERQATKNFPDGVVSWAALAATEHDVAGMTSSFKTVESNAIAVKQLKNWVVEIGQTASGQRALGIFPRETEEAQQDLLVSHVFVNPK